MTILCRIIPAQRTRRRQQPRIAVSDRSALGRSGGGCNNLMLTSRKSLIINGDMSEWLKEHDWKAVRCNNVETYRITFSAVVSTTSPPRGLSLYLPVVTVFVEGRHPLGHNLGHNFRRPICQSVSSNASDFPRVIRSVSDLTGRRRPSHRRGFKSSPRKSIPLEPTVLRTYRSLSPAARFEPAPAYVVSTGYCDLLDR